MVESWDLRDFSILSEEEDGELMKHFDKLLDKAESDPFYNPQSKKKESKKPKTFNGYNWTTHKKKIAGIKGKIKELKSKTELDDKEQITLKRMQALLKWHSWALTKHKEGWSDKRIHEETQARKRK